MKVKSDPKFSYDKYYFTNPHLFFRDYYININKFEKNK